MENWSYGLKSTKSQALRVDAKPRSYVPTLKEWKRNEVTTINIVQAQVEEMYFIFNLEYRRATLSRRKFHAQPKPKNPSEMSEI
jgi:hypothetical protein